MNEIRLLLVFTSLLSLSRIDLFFFLSFSLFPSFFPRKLCCCLLLMTFSRYLSACARPRGVEIQRRVSHTHCNSSADDLQIYFLLYSFLFFLVCLQLSLPFFLFSRSLYAVEVTLSVSFLSFVFSLSFFVLLCPSTSSPSSRFSFSAQATTMRLVFFFPFFTHARKSLSCVSFFLVLDSFLRLYSGGVEAAVQRSSSIHQANRVMRPCMQSRILRGRTKEKQNNNSPHLS